MLGAGECAGAVPEEVKVDAALLAALAQARAQNNKVRPFRFTPFSEIDPSVRGFPLDIAIVAKALSGATDCKCPLYFFLLLSLGFLFFFSPTFFLGPALFFFFLSLSVSFSLSLSLPFWLFLSSAHLHFFPLYPVVCVVFHSIFPLFDHNISQVYCLIGIFFWMEHSSCGADVVRFT